MMFVSLSSDYVPTFFTPVYHTSEVRLHHRLGPSDDTLGSDSAESVVVGGANELLRTSNSRVVVHHCTVIRFRS